MAANGANGSVAHQQQPLFDLVCFTFIIDDIVLPDGMTCMAQLGGGGPQSLFGFQLVHSALHEGVPARLALAAGVGPDVPDSCVDTLRRLVVDMKGLVTHDRPTPRAWQVFEADGRRTQVWRGLGDPCDELYTMLRPRWDTLPNQHKSSTVNYHIGVHPLHPPMKLLRTLRGAAHAHGGLLSVEPYTAAERPATADEVKALLSECDIFSPNQAEAESMVGKGDPEEMVERLLSAAGPSGAGLVTIRCAEKGVVSRLADNNATCLVPAVADTRVVDVTGAGNAFCGGFLAAVHASGPTSPLHRAIRRRLSVNSDPTSHTAVDELVFAASWGCAAASVMIEEVGVPRTTLDVLQGRARGRHAALVPRSRVAQRIQHVMGGAGSGASLRAVGVPGVVSMIDTVGKRVKAPAGVNTSASCVGGRGAAWRRGVLQSSGRAAYVGAIGDDERDGWGWGGWGTVAGGCRHVRACVDAAVLVRCPPRHAAGDVQRRVWLPSHGGRRVHAGAAGAMSHSVHRFASVSYEVNMRYVM